MEIHDVIMNLNSYLLCLAICSFVNQVKINYQLQISSRMFLFYTSVLLLSSMNKIMISEVLIADYFEKMTANNLKLKDYGRLYNKVINKRSFTFTIILWKQYNLRLYLNAQCKYLPVLIYNKVNRTMQPTIQFFKYLIYSIILCKNLALKYTML